MYYKYALIATIGAILIVGGCVSPKKAGLAYKEDALLLTAEGILDAAGSGNASKVNRIILKNYDLINAKNKDGATPLHLASNPFIYSNGLSIFGNYSRTVYVLVRLGADVNAKDNSGRTPLHYITSLPDWGTKLEFIQNGQSITPETLAVDIATKLINGGAEVNATVESGSNATPLHYAVYRGYKNVVELLIKHGADVNARAFRGGKSSLTPLDVARTNGRTEIVDILLKYGAKSGQDSPPGK